MTLAEIKIQARCTMFEAMEDGLESGKVLALAACTNNEEREMVRELYRAERRRLVSLWVSAVDAHLDGKVTA